MGGRYLQVSALLTYGSSRNKKRCCGEREREHTLYLVYLHQKHLSSLIVTSSIERVHTTIYSSSPLLRFLESISILVVSLSSKLKEERRSKVYNLDTPVQNFAPSRLYIDDGEERKNIAIGKSLTDEIIRDFRRISSEPSVNAQFDFQVTKRSSPSLILRDSRTGVEVRAVLRTEECNSQPRKLTIPKIGSYRPSSIERKSK